MLHTLYMCEKVWFCFKMMENIQTIIYKSCCSLVIFLLMNRILIIVIVIVIIIIILISLKEGITQSQVINSGKLRILRILRIHKEENGHIHGLARQESLLLEAETLNLVKIQSSPWRMDIVRGNARDGLIGMVGRREEAEGSLTGNHLHIELGGYETPGHDIGDGAIESHGEKSSIVNGSKGCQTFGRFLVRPCFGRLSRSSVFGLILGGGKGGENILCEIGRLDQFIVHALTELGSVGIFHAISLGCPIGECDALRCAAETRCLTEHFVERDGGVGCSQGSNDRGEGVGCDTYVIVVYGCMGCGG
mmetsp:Transcript_21293/g.29864  ORF Transcript_21293/g.29864 Transcript_21293/m.29864 type:complete len:306 (-) Transcript_21293:504-1421(-)